LILLHNYATLAEVINFDNQHGVSSQVILKLSILITTIRPMKRRFLIEKLDDADRRGVWAFTPATFGALLGNPAPDYLKLMMKRLADQGVLVRAARGLYVNPRARSMPSDARTGLIRFLRPREISYVSLESKLSEAGAISQVPTVLSCMTTGSPGRFDTPWGAIEFTHTDRDIALGTEVHMRDDGLLEATVERSARDLRRVGRNVGLIDPETLAEAIAEERNYERQG
jgi:hypothetical protein